MFTQNNRKAKKELNPVLRGKVERMTKAIVIKQVKFAGFLQRKSELLSATSKILILVLFCLISCAYSTHLIMSALKSQSALSNMAVQPLPMINKTEQDIKSNQAMITRKDHLAMLKLRVFLDSLKQSPNGKVKYEKFVRERAGLLDSINEVERVYRQHSK